MDKHHKIAALVIKAREGSESAFESLYETCFDSVYFLALRIMKNPGDAEDAAQEAFLSVFRNLSKLKEPLTFTKWINKTVYNLCLRNIEKSKGRALDEDFDELDNTLFDDNEDIIPERALLNADRRETVLRAVESLSDNQRLVIMMFYFDGFSLAEIGDLTGLRQGAVSKRLFDARNALKLKLSDYDFR